MKSECLMGNRRSEITDVTHSPNRIEFILVALNCVIELRLSILGARV